ncbi:Putative ribonuclease H protein At1g65750 [Linum perenne]
MDAPVASSGEDELIWGPDPKGNFSISSAYEIITAESNSFESPLWKLVWKWQGPNRVRHFLWLAAHNRFLTNAERRKRHMMTEDFCRLCPHSVEGVLHVLWDCRLAKTFWEGFLPTADMASFFSGNIQDWMSNILKDTELCLPGGIALWLLWKARNEDIFEGSLGSSWSEKGNTYQVVPAPDEWITVNTDGSVIQPQNLATGGGVIRNFEGQKLAAFAANFGRCTIMRAELRAALMGLEYAWEIGARKVNIQLDTLASISSIQGGPDLDGRHSHTLNRIRELRQRN